MKNRQEANQTRFSYFILPKAVGESRAFVGCLAAKFVGGFATGFKPFPVCMSFFLLLLSPILLYFCSSSYNTSGTSCGQRKQRLKNRYINGTSNSSKSKCHAADFGFQIVHLNPFHFAFLTPRHGYRGKDKQKKSESKCYKLAECIQPYRRRHEGKESDWKQAKKRERERESATLRAHPPTVLWSFDLCKIFSNFTQEQRKKKDGNSLPRKRSASKGE